MANVPETPEASSANLHREGDPQTWIEYGPDGKPIRSYISPDVITVANFMNIPTSNLDVQPMLHGDLRNLVEVIRGMAGSVDRTTIGRAIAEIEDGLKPSTSPESRLQKLFEFSRLSVQRSRLNSELESIKRDPRDLHNMESAAKETGNWGPYLKAVAQKEAQTHVE